MADEKVQVLSIRVVGQRNEAPFHYGNFVYLCNEAEC